MIRVLQYVESLGTGGIQSFLMTVYRHIDRERVQFDFLLQRRFNNDYEREVEELGGKLYFLPPRREGLRKSRKALANFFAEHPEYKTVHIHVSSLTYIDPLIAAQKAGVPQRIVHSHNTRASGSKIHTLLHRLNQKRVGRVATEYYACSDLAADWFYGNGALREKAVLIANVINSTKFAYDEAVRQSYRRENGWENKTVLGHVGRFHHQKNHLYLIDIFHAYVKTDDSAMLVLVGDGGLRPSIEEKVKSLGLEDRVCFLGDRSDVAELLQAFDLFLLPSHHEGFPVTMVEAQAAGLHCVSSDTVTDTSDLTGMVTFCSIDQPADAWVKPIAAALARGRNASAIEQIRSAGFDAADVAENLCETYSRVY